MPNFGACRCGTRWQQIGNQTGHCSACHHTFASLDAFDAHQRMVNGKSVCVDPAFLRTGAGAPRFKTVADSVGTPVWHSAKELDVTVWDRSTPNRAAHPPNQPRTGAGGSPEPPQDSDASQTGLAR